MLKKQSNWASKKDIKKYADHKNSKNNIILTNDTKLKLKGGALNTNVLVIGSSGSGKTYKYVEKNIMQMNSSYVVTCNPSDNVLDKHKEILSQNGYKIKFLNLHLLKESMHYNPFEYIRNESFSKDISLIVDTVIANTSSSYIDHFWSQMDEVLLKACIAIIKVRCKEEEKNFSSLIEMIEIESDIEGSLDPLFIASEKLINNDYSPTVIPNGEYIKVNKTETSLTDDEIAIYKYAVKHYEIYKNTPNSTRRAIIQSCLERLNSFLNDDVLELTSYDEMELNKIDDRRTAVFINLDLAGNDILSAMMYAQIFNILSAKSENKRELKSHVHFMMDEFETIGYIPNLTSFTVTSRGMDISISICLSSITQLKLRYNDKYNDNAKSIISCCDTVLFLGLFFSGINEPTLDFITTQIGITVQDLWYGNLLDAVRLENEYILIFRGEKPFISKKLMKKFINQTKCNYVVIGGSGVGKVKSYIAPNDVFDGKDQK